LFTNRLLPGRAAIFLLCAFAVTLHGQVPDLAPYRNPDLPPAQRAADLVARMTLEEKVLQM
jgi:beta-glucosidase